MKKDFVQLIKDVRITLKPLFHKVASAKETTPEQMDQALSEIEVKQEQMVIDAGYTFQEFNQLLREYFIDFSPENPDEWVIRHDPENAVIITFKF